jgi:hypothetical protein
MEKTINKIAYLDGIRETAASWLMARFVDAPGIRLSKYVYTRFFKKSAAA